MRAIVHAHTKYTVFRSLIGDSIEPVDSEGRLLLGAKVPVLAPEKTVASEEVAALMAEQVASGVAVAVIRGHGPFAWADSLENAFRLISCLEYSAEMLTLFEMTKRKLK
jgi:L-fuculose-phosphate aldolase